MTKRFVRLLLRILTITLLLAAIANIKLPAKSRKIARIHLVDISQSVKSLENDKDAINLNDVTNLVNFDLSRMSENDLVAVAVFAKNTSFLQSPVPRKDFKFISDLTAKIDTDHTAIADALETTLLQLPPDCMKEIYLYSDGNDTEGELDLALSQLRQNNVNPVRSGTSQGVKVYTIPIGSYKSDDARIDSIDYPFFVASDEKFDLKISIYSTTDGLAKIKLGDITQDVNLVANAKVLAIIKELTIQADPRLYKISVEPVTFVDSCPLNNSISFAVYKKTTKKKVLLVSKYQSQIPDLLKDHFVVKTASSLEDSSGFDCVILENYPLTDEKKESMQALATFVKDFGKSLLILGGNNSFGLGNYHETPIEQISPVWAFPDERISAVYILDKSGSMGEQVNDQRKIDIATSAIVNSMKLLDNADFFSLITFDLDSRVLVPLAQSVQKYEVAQKLDKISAQGPTKILPAIEKAIDILKTAKTSKRQIILISDGQTDEGVDDFIKKASELSEMGIRIFVVATGKEKSQALEKLASGPDSKFCPVDKITELSSILDEIVARAKELTIENPKIKKSIPHEATDEIYSFDWIKKANRTSAKQGALVLLESSHGPIMAMINSGLGTVIAITTSGLKGWAEGGNYGRLVTQSVNYLTAQDRNYFFIEREKNKIKVSFPADSVPQEIGSIMAAYINVSESEQGTLELIRSSSNSFSGELTQTKSGTYYVSTQAPVNAHGFFNILYPAEYNVIGINIPALRMIANSTGGRLIDNFYNFTDPARKTLQKVYVDGRPYFVVLALILFLLDIALGVFWK